LKKLFLIAILISVLAAFFASSHPDGLDFVAERYGFAEKSHEHSAPMPGYSLNFLPESSISTSAAGLAGILILLGIFGLVAFVLKNKKKGLSKVLVAVFVLFLASTPVFAARPLITDDFYTVPQGNYEIEAGYSSVQNPASAVNGLNLSVKRGFSPNFDLGIEVPYTTSSPSGLNDMYLHLKYSFWKKSEDEGITGRVDFKSNNGNISQGLGSGDNDYCLMLIYSKMIGDTKMHLNMGHVNVGLNAGLPTDDYFAYALAFEHPVWGGRGDVVAEYVANNAVIPNPAFVQIGMRCLVAEGIKVDAGYGFGLNNNSTRNSLTAGIHYEI